MKALHDIPSKNTQYDDVLCHFQIILHKSKEEVLNQGKHKVFLRYQAMYMPLMHEILYPWLFLTFQALAHHHFLNS